MDILHRYLAEIERSLPKTKRADIAAEIADELHSQFEERAASLDRRLTHDEAVGILRAFGHPRAVAARYGDQRALIGPELLPLYWTLLKILIGADVAFLMIESALHAVARNEASVYWNWMAAGWQGPIWIFGIVTIVFVLVQRSGNQWMQRWEPRRLPPAVKNNDPSRTTSGWECIVNVVLLILLLGVVAHWDIVYSDPWKPLFVTFIANCGINAIALGTVFFWPRWNWLRSLARVFANAVSAAGAVVALHSLGHAPTPLRPILLVFLAIVAIACVLAIWNLLGRAANPYAPDSA